MVLGCGSRGSVGRENLRRRGPYFCHANAIDGAGPRYPSAPLRCRRPALRARGLPGGDGGVGGFGEFLSGQGFPAGELLAWGLTLFEIVGAPLLAVGVGVVPLALLFSAELVAGIVLVHRHAGWFVVGGGRNGVEYSLCLILALVACALSEARARRSASAAPRA